MHAGTRAGMAFVETNTILFWYTLIIEIKVIQTETQI